MKKSFSKIILFPTLVFGIISLSGCSFISELLSGLNGSNQNPTTDEKENCEHEFDDGVPMDDVATCQTKGKVKFTCLKCGYSETRTSYAPHTPLDDTFEYNDTYHYQTCKWCESIINKEEHDIKEDIIVQYDCTKDGECRYYCDKCEYEHTDIHPAEHYFHEKTHIEPTCEETGLIEYDPCPGCGLTKDDEILDIVPHQYMGETCIYCQRDAMLDYIDDFDNHGKTYTDPINIDNEQELLSLQYYVHLNRAERYFDIKYSFEGTLQKHLFAALDKCTDANYARKFTCDGATRGSFVANDTDFDNQYIKKSGVDYVEKINKQIENPIDDIFLAKGNRSNSFNNFKIDERKYELSVRTTDDLFYALSHGYNPIPEASSKAERAFNKLKDISREIISDSMSDIEKAFSFYCWLIKNVVYDHGAVLVTDSGELDNTTLASWGMEGCLYEGKAICDSISKTFASLCALENIRCVQAKGNSHAWNKIYLNLDGEYKWYLVDATFANGSLNNNYEIASHDEFLYSDAYKENNGYKSDTYLDCKALRDIDAYEIINYANSKNLLIESDAELKDYISSFASEFKEHQSNGKDVSVEIATPKTYSPNINTLSNYFKTYLNWDPKGSLSFTYKEHDNYIVNIYNYYN